MCALGAAAPLMAIAEVADWREVRARLVEGSGEVKWGCSGVSVP